MAGTRKRRKVASTDRDSGVLIDKVLEQLRGLGRMTADEGSTAEELATKAGRGVEWVRARLREAKSRGLLIVGTAPRERLDGQVAHLPVYRIREAK
jgi:hypothetical protein